VAAGLRAIVGFLRGLLGFLRSLLFLLRRFGAAFVVVCVALGQGRARIHFWLRLVGRRRGVLSWRVEFLAQVLHLSRRCFQNAAERHGRWRRLIGELFDAAFIHPHPLC